MQIALNGEPHVVPEACTVTELLASLGLGEARVAVERNREIIPSAARPNQHLADGDQLEIVTFVGGG